MISWLWLVFLVLYNVEFVWVIIDFWSFLCIIVKLKFVFIDKDILLRCNGLVFSVLIILLIIIVVFLIE